MRGTNVSILPTKTNDKTKKKQRTKDP